MSNPQWEQVVDAPKQVETWRLDLKSSVLHLYQPVGMTSTWVVYASGALKVKQHDLEAENREEAQLKAVMYFLDLLSKASLEATKSLPGMVPKK